MIMSLEPHEVLDDDDANDKQKTIGFMSETRALVVHHAF